SFVLKSFRIVRARRSAILLNGARVSPDDFVSRIYRERDVEGSQPFALSGKVIDEVYATGYPLMSDDITSVLCAPLKDKETGNIFGIFYREGAEPGETFPHEDWRYVRAMAAATATAMKNSRRLESHKAENKALRRQLGGYDLIGQTKL